MRHEFQADFADIKLIPLSKGDSEKYRLLRNLPEVRNCFGNNAVISAEEQSVWYENYLEKPDEIMLAVYHREVFLGCNSIYQIDYVHKLAEYGRIIIDKQFSGNNYGFKATMAAIKIAKEQLKLKKIYLEVYKDNIPAIISYRRAEFEEVGQLKDYQGKEMLRMRNDLC